MKDNEFTIGVANAFPSRARERDKPQESLRSEASAANDPSAHSNSGDGFTSYDATQVPLRQDGDHATTPASLGLPHKTFRKGQLQSILWVADRQPTGSDESRVASFLEAKPGSGKTAVAASMPVVAGRAVASLVETKRLQIDTYGAIYNFDVLLGAANYNCISPDEPHGTNCGDCSFSDNRKGCPFLSECEYHIAKMIARQSDKVSLNYAYWLVSRYWRENPPDTLFCDECHMLPDIVLRFVGCTITFADRDDWWLPGFPDIDSTKSNAISRMPGQKGGGPTDIAIAYLDDCGETLTQEMFSLSGKVSASPDDRGLRKRLEKCTRLRSKVYRTRNKLRQSGIGWFILSGKPLAKTQGTLRQSGKAPGFVCKPLSAKAHFKDLFMVSPQTVLMSATIGDAKTFATELGIADCEMRSVPSNWDAWQQPIYTLDVPKLSYRSSDQDYMKQANAIAVAIAGCPGDWSGIIHVTKKSFAKKLAERIGRCNSSVGFRLWVPPFDVGTHRQVELWHRQLERKPNSIIISWALHEGYDGTQERMNIVAKVPFPFLGDPYEKARMTASGGMYRQRTAWALEQMLGRTRRGNARDYDTENERMGYVAIADANWVRVRKYLSQQTLESIGAGQGMLQGKLL